METKAIPFYAKASLIFIGLFALITMLYLAKQIIVPIIFSVIISIVLCPIVDFFIRRKIRRGLAIAITLALVSIILISLLGLLSTQLNSFTDALPKLIDKFYETLNSSIDWTSDTFNVSTKKINTYIVDTKIAMMGASRSTIGSTISTMGSALVIIVLVPVYVFMILFYKPLLLDFIRRVFGKGNLVEVNEVLTSTRKIIQSYLIGLLVEAAIIAILNSIGLLILGIEYAVLLGILGAILNVIPYLGGIIAMTLYAIIALVSKDSSIYIVYVLGMYTVIQLIDNNYLVPKIVGSKVKINALVSIVVVIAGGALWGIPGMFLSIPLTAILKVIFDHIETLKPWGFLLGDTMPEISIFKIKTNK